MTEQSEAVRESRFYMWLVLAVAAVLFVAGSGGLLWLLWRYVPVHAAIFEGMAAPLPPSTRVVIAASNWTARLLPIVIFASMLFGGPLLVGLIMLVTWRGARRWVVRCVVGLALVAAICPAFACGFVVYGIHAGYAAARDTHFQSASDAAAVTASFGA